MAARATAPTTAPRSVGGRPEAVAEMNASSGHDLSAAIFGNRYFAAVVDAAARLDETEGYFTARTVAKATAIADGLVRPVLMRLITADILIPAARTGGTRSPRYYKLARSEATATVVAAARAALGPPSDNSA